MKVPPRTRSAACLGLVFLLFLGFYLKILFRGYSTDFPAHIILAHFSYVDQIDTPHRVYGMLLKVAANAAHLLGLDAVPRLLGISTHGMMTLYVDELRVIAASTGAHLLAQAPMNSEMLIDYHIASAFLAACFVTLSAFLIFRLQRIVFAGLELHPMVAYAAAMMALLVTPIFVPDFTGNLYVGQGSGNVWHSPTYLLMKPFAYLTLLLLAPILWRGDGSRGRLALGSIALAASVLAKPSFAIVFLPAAFLLSLATGVGNIRSHLQLSIVSLPAVAVLGAQYLSTFAEVDSGGIVFMPGRVWSLYTPSIPTSLVLALFFPMIVGLLALWGIMRVRRSYLLSWMMLAVALAQCLLLAEAGPRLPDFNFFWGYNIALDVLFIFSIAELLRWMARIFAADSTAAIEPGWRQWSWKARFLPTVLGAALLTHVVSGTIYMARIFLGYTYY